MCVSGPMYITCRRAANILPWQSKTLTGMVSGWWEWALTFKKSVQLKLGIHCFLITRLTEITSTLYSSPQGIKVSSTMAAHQARFSITRSNCVFGLADGNVRSGHRWGSCHSGALGQDCDSSVWSPGWCSRTISKYNHTTSCHDLVRAGLRQKQRRLLMTPVNFRPWHVTSSGLAVRGSSVCS